MYLDSKDWYPDAYVSHPWGKVEEVIEPAPQRTPRARIWRVGVVASRAGVAAARFCFLLGLPLAVRAPRCTQLARGEVVRRPGTANEDLAVLELPCRAVVTVLVALDRLLLDQVSYVDEHSAGLVLAAGHIFFERMEELVHLNRESAGFGLALA